ncbi:M23 family metallopeptidase [Acaryochloris sp. 'Moss Beach']|uniref:M23 family metallopeptidase n=1 Tax=Acaryochloris sp. 'Moss Beach' TaxID=2740837 RepID=UPI001F29E32E|nr:M23 family metallopeptidase [Acaryochloris sp. 'Moss Beach']
MAILLLSTIKNGYSTLYAHLSEVQVRANQKVTKSTPIALSGNTGRSTGPHLHFEVVRTVNGVTPRKGGHNQPRIFS